MNAIMGIADLLAKTSLTPEQDKYVQIFRRSGDNLLNLINDTLDLSKVEASQLHLERTGLSLGDHLEKVIEMVAPKAQGKGLTLVCEIAPSVANDLVGDPTRLRQVLLNLLGNAIKFTEVGEVSLKVEADQDPTAPTALRFTVSDSGIGIADSKLAPVFEFWRPSARLLALIPAYLDSCQQNVVTMRDALDRADVEPMTILGHNMHGSGGGFGFQPSPTLGRASTGC